MQEESRRPNNRYFITTASGVNLKRSGKLPTRVCNYFKALLKAAIQYLRAR